MIFKHSSLTYEKAVINSFRRSPARTWHGSWYLDVTVDMTVILTSSWKGLRKDACKKQFTNQFDLESWCDHTRTTSWFCTVLLHCRLCLSRLRKVNTCNNSYHSSKRNLSLHHRLHQINTYRQLLHHCWQWDKTSSCKQYRTTNRGSKTYGESNYTHTHTHSISSAPITGRQWVHYK